MSAQPRLFEPVRDPDAPPLRLRLSIDCNGFVMEARGRTAEQWDELHRCCAPHRIAEFLEIVE